VTCLHIHRWASARSLAYLKEKKKEDKEMTKTKTTKTAKTKAAFTLKDITRNTVLNTSDYDRIIANMVTSGLIEVVDAKKAQNFAYSLATDLMVSAKKTEDYQAYKAEHKSASKTELKTFRESLTLKYASTLEPTRSDMKVFRKMVLAYKDKALFNKCLETVGLRCSTQAAYKNFIQATCNVGFTPTQKGFKMCMVVLLDNGTLTRNMGRLEKKISHKMKKLENIEKK